MHARSLLPLLLLAACPRSGAGTRTPEAGGDAAAPASTPTIDGAWMRSFVEAFAADDMNGRFTLDPTSIERAAGVIADQYAAMGLAKVGDDYRVPFEFAYGNTVERAHHVWVEAKGPARALPPEQSATLSAADETTVVADVVFAGPRAIAKPPATVRDRIVFVRDPLAAGAAAPADNADLRALAERLAAQKAKALVVLGDRVPGADTAAWPLPVVALRAPAVESIVAAAGTDLAKLSAEMNTAALSGVRLSIAPRRTDKIERAANVLAWIPGTDAKSEIVLLGAHYDHIGTTERGQMCRGPDGDTICNGADDNASGTGMVLAMAKAMHAARYRPKRTIVFAHFAGEELGLHGSKALANHLPAAAPFAGGKIVAMINFDMVGRLGKDGLWVGAVSTSSAWMPLLDEIGTEGVPTVFERSVTARSDHASFFEHDIPVLFFFTGLHADYHRPGDESAAMNFDGMTKIGTIALKLAAALGDGAAIPFTKPSDDEGIVTRLPGSDAKTVEKAPAP
jgi:hypothetical protein